LVRRQIPHTGYLGIHSFLRQQNELPILNDCHTELEVSVESARLVGLENCHHCGEQTRAAFDEIGEYEFKSTVVVLGQHEECLRLSTKTGMGLPYGDVLDTSVANT